MVNKPPMSLGVGGRLEAQAGRHQMSAPRHKKTLSRSCTRQRSDLHPLSLAGKSGADI